MSNTLIPVLTKSLLITKISKKRKIRRLDIDVIVSDILKEIGNSLAQGHRVQLKPLGSLHPIIRREKYVRNITAGTSFTMPETIAVKFFPTGEMTKRLRGLADLHRRSGSLSS